MPDPGPSPQRPKSDSQPLSYPSNSAAPPCRNDLSQECVDASPYGIRIAEPDGRIVLYNRTLEQITGYSREEIPDIATWMAKVYPDPAYRALAAYLRGEFRKSAGTSGRPLETRQIMLTRKDGQVRLCRITLTMMPSGAGLAFVRDSREWWEGKGDGEPEPPLREDPFPLFNWVLGPEGRFVLFGFNHEAERWVGRDLRARLARDVSELFQEPEAICADMQYCLSHRTSLHRKTGFRLTSRGEDAYAAATFTFSPPHYVTMQLVDLTDLRRTERKLELSERKFIEFADLLPEIVFELDLQGRITFLNRSGAMRMGYPDGNYPIGATAFDYFIPEDLPRVQENFARVMAGVDLGINEYTMRRRDGTTFSALLRSGLLIENGRATGARGFIIDITARKQVEQALQASEGRFALLTQTSPNGFAINRLSDGLYLEANRSECLMTGYSREELIGRTSVELNLWVDPEDRARLRQMLVETGSVSGFSTRLRRKSGEIRECLFFASLAEFAGEPYILSEIADITELRRTEEALRLSEERLRMATEGAGVGMWDWDVVRGTFHCNDTYFRMLGYTPWEFTPTYERWLELIHPEDRTEADRLTRESRVRGSRTQSAEYRMRGKDGSYRWIHDSWYVAGHTPEGDALRALGIHIDITERKRMDTELRRSHEELEGRVQERTAELMEANRSLKQQVQRCRAIESTLRSKERQLKKRRDDLAETNSALKVLLKQHEENQREIEDRIAAQLKQMVLPHVAKLKKGKLPGRMAAHLDALECNLMEIASPFAKVLSENLYNLTPTEMQVAGLIKMDKSTKDIASELHLSPKTVEFHRYNIRRKMGLGRKRLNLRSFLKTLK
jgi:PAS domain S-box-containing protein